VSERGKDAARHYPIAKEVLVLFVPLLVLGTVFLVSKVWIAGGIFIALSLFVLYFFRNPRLEYEHVPGTILSPAFGKVVGIVDVLEPEYMGREANRVSIFLRIYDVHMNYTPVDGILEYKRYHKGRFGIAGFDKASDLNEHMTVGVSNGGERLSFKIIAGMIARRIVMPLEEGSSIRAGERIGMVKFGSRADVFVPPEYEITVRLGQKVRGPLTVIARKR
jgi:phosphatidylserine decarboxylase